MKSHFTFSKERRNGIFLLLLIIIVIQCAYIFQDSSQQDISINNVKLIKYQNEIDLLKLIEAENNQLKIFPLF
jgi:competence protein ComEA